ncbi:hypothetical protein VTI28DRAFT_7559 [Corynascus sepedonium]
MIAFVRAWPWLSMSGKHNTERSWRNTLSRSPNSAKIDMANCSARSQSSNTSTRTGCPSTCPPFPMTAISSKRSPKRTPTARVSFMRPTTASKCRTPERPFPN